MDLDDKYWWLFVGACVFSLAASAAVFWVGCLIVKAVFGL